MCLKRKENQENPNDIELILNENIQTLKNLTKEQNKLLQAVKHIFVKFIQSILLENLLNSLK